MGEGTPIGDDIALLMATAWQMITSDDPEQAVKGTWGLAGQIIGRHRAQPVVESLTMMIVADVMAVRLTSPGLDAETVVQPALDMADMLAQGDSPARWWVSVVLANPEAPSPEVPSGEDEAFNLVIGLVSVLLVTYTLRMVAQAAPLDLG